MSDTIDNALGATTGLLAVGIMANVAGKTMKGLGSAKSKGSDWFSSKSSSKHKGGMKW